METVTVVIESPVKYDMPHSAGMYGYVGNKRKKTKKEKIIDKITKSIRERD